MAKKDEERVARILADWETVYIYETLTDEQKIEVDLFVRRLAKENKNNGDEKGTDQEHNM